MGWIGIKINFIRPDKLFSSFVQNIRHAGTDGGAAVLVREDGGKAENVPFCQGEPQVRKGVEVIAVKPLKTVRLVAGLRPGDQGLVFEQTYPYR